jgi:hypothetical protein
MPKQRIALKVRHFDDCLNACGPDAQFAEAFQKVRILFAQCAIEHERHRAEDDVSAEDIERELLRAYVSTTVWARMQVLARGRLRERCLATPLSTEGSMRDAQPSAQGTS